MKVLYRHITPSVSALLRSTPSFRQARMNRYIRPVLLLMLVAALAGTAFAGDVTEVVLFSGGISPANNYPRYYTDMARAWDITTDLFGVNNVYVLWANGVNGDGIGVADESNGSNSDWSFVPAGHILAATAGNLQTTLEDTVPEAGGADYSFLFYSFDHGGPLTDNSTTSVVLNGWGGSDISNTQFATWAGSLTATQQLYDFNECYSKGMTQPLLGNSSGNVFVMWAASYCSFSNGFSNAFLNAIDPSVADLSITSAIGQYAVQNDPYGPNGPVDTRNQEDPGYAGSDFNILTNEAVPEPASVAYGLLGIGAIWLSRRRGMKLS